jgi:hypothetical protein
MKKKRLEKFLRWIRQGAYERRSVDMVRWCGLYCDHPTVKDWLAENPPPKDWTGSKIEWAFLEMPFWLTRTLDSDSN